MGKLIKKNDMKIMRISIVILFLLIACLILIICDSNPRIKKDVNYPDLISPIYFGDFFIINSPRIAIVDNQFYFFCFDNLTPFENKEEFLVQEGVSRLFLNDLCNMFRFDVYNDIYDNSKFKDNNKDFGINYEELLFLPDGNINGIAIYKFAFEPKEYLLSLQGTTKAVVNLVNNTSITWRGTPPEEPVCCDEPNSYFIEVIPLYKKRDCKIMDQIAAKKVITEINRIEWDEDYNEIHNSRVKLLETAVNNFLGCKLSKIHDIFRVGFSENIFRYEANYDDISSLYIVPSYFTYHITPSDTIGSTELPTRHLIKDGKLFYWYDEYYGLTEEFVNAFSNFGIIDTIESGFRYNFRDKVENPKIATYFFCKNDLSKYKRVITRNVNSPFYRWYYKKPRIKCIEK